MRTAALMYHDVVPPGQWDASGFAGPDAARYKLEREAFRAHLDCIAAAAPDGVATVESLLGDPGPQNGRLPVLLTFDDGGSSAAEEIAPLLEQRGWRGHFFVTAGRIGTPGFLTPDQIRALGARGHVIGSHSYSHPLQMGRLGREELEREWSRSLGRLGEILGTPVTSASVPGGYYSPRVAETAERAGVRVLFTSEPVLSVRRVGSALVLGRYTVRRGTPPRLTGRAAAGSPAAWLTQRTTWNLRKPLKRIGGGSYVRIRRLLLQERSGNE